MSIPLGTISYTTTHACCHTEGRELAEADLNKGIPQIAATLHDEGGMANITQALEGTGFDKTALVDLLSEAYTPKTWELGEVLAEVYLTAHKNCSFPWPVSRDKKMPKASPSGADLVGFVHEKDNTWFAFGEVKTSEEKKYPPQVVAGLQDQLARLVNTVEICKQLVRYLGTRATGAAWQEDFKRATTGFLKNHHNIRLFGVLVRDVAPQEKDLAVCTQNIGNACKVGMQAQLIGLYLPPATIGTLPQKVLS